MEELKARESQEIIHTPSGSKASGVLKNCFQIGMVVGSASAIVLAILGIAFRKEIYDTLKEVISNPSIITDQVSQFASSAFKWLADNPVATAGIVVGAVALNAAAAVVGTAAVYIWNHRGDSEPGNRLPGEEITYDPAFKVPQQGSMREGQAEATISVFIKTSKSSVDLMHSGALFFNRGLLKKAIASLDARDKGSYVDKQLKAMEAAGRQDQASLVRDIREELKREPLTATDNVGGTAVDEREMSGEEAKAQILNYKKFDSQVVYEMGHEGKWPEHRWLLIRAVQRLDALDGGTYVNSKIEEMKSANQSDHGRFLAQIRVRLKAHQKAPNTGA